MRRPRNQLGIKMLVIIFALIFLVGVALANEPGRLNIETSVNMVLVSADTPFPPIVVATPSALIAP